MKCTQACCRTIQTHSPIEMAERRKQIELQNRLARAVRRLHEMNNRGELG